MSKVVRILQQYLPLVVINGYQGWVIMKVSNQNIKTLKQKKFFDYENTWKNMSMTQHGSILVWALYISTLQNKIGFKIFELNLSLVKIENSGATWITRLYKRH